MPPVQTTTLYFNVTWVDAETFATWCDSDENIYGLQASDFGATAFATVAAAVDADRFAHTEPTSFTIVQAQKDPDGGGHATPLNLKTIAPLLVDGDVLTIQDDNDLNALLNNDNEKMQLTADVTITGVVRQAIHVGEKANGDAATLTIPENGELYVGGSLFSGYNGGNTKGAVIVDGTLFTGQLVVRPNGTVDVSETGRFETLRKHDIPMVNGDVTVVGDGTFEQDNVVFREFNIYDNLGTKDSATGTVYKDRLHSYTDSSISVQGTFLMGRTSEKTPEATEARIVNLTVTLDNSRLTQTNDDPTLEQWSNAVIIGSDLKPAGAHLYNNYGNAANGSKSNTFVNLTNNSVFDAQGYILLGSDRTVTRKLPTGVTDAPWQATARSKITIDTTSTLRFGAGLYIYNAAEHIGDPYKGGTIVIDGAIDAEAEQDLYIWIDGSASTEGINLQLRDGTNDIADLEHAITIEGVKSEDFTYVENVNNSYYAFRTSAYDVEDILVSTDWADLTLGDEIVIGDKTYTYGITAFSSLGDASAAASADSVVTLVDDAYAITIDDMRAFARNDITFAGEATLTAADNGWRAWAADTANPTTITLAEGSVFTINGSLYAGWNEDWSSKTGAGGNFVIEGDLTVKWINANPVEEFTITETGSVTVTAATDATFLGNKLVTITGDGTKETASLYITAGNGCLNMWDDAPLSVKHESEMNVTDALVKVDGMLYLGRTIHEHKTKANLKGHQDINLDNSTFIVTGNDTKAAVNIGSTIMPAGSGNTGPEMSDYYGAGANDYNLRLRNGSLFKAVSGGTQKNAVILGANHTYTCTDDMDSITQHNSIFIDVTSTLSYDNGLYIYNAAENVGDTYAGGTIVIYGEIDAEAEQDLYVWIDGSASADGIHLLLNDGKNDIADLNKAITITGEKSEDFTYVENVNNSYYAFRTSAFDMEDILVSTEWAGMALGTEIVIGDKTYTYGITAFSTIGDASGVAGATSVVTLLNNAYTITEADMAALAYHNITLAGEATLTVASGGWRTWSADAENPTTITIAAGSSFNVTSDVYAGWSSNYKTIAGGNFVVEGDLTVKWLNCNPNEEITITENGSLTITARSDATFAGNKLWTINGDGTKETASLYLTAGNGCLNIWDDTPETNQHMSEMNVNDALVQVVGTMYFGRTIHQTKVSADLQGRQEVNLNNSTMIVTGNNEYAGISIGSTILPDGTGIFGNDYYGAGANDYMLTLSNGSLFKAVTAGSKKQAIALGADHFYDCTDGQTSITQHNSIVIDVTSTLSYDNGLYIYNAAANVGDDYAGGTIVIDGAIAADSTRAAYVWIDGSASADGIHLLLNDGTDDSDDLDQAITIEGVKNENYIYLENVNNSYLAYRSDIQDTETIIVSG